jgi:hypothetical protein
MSPWVSAATRPEKNSKSPASTLQRFRGAWETAPFARLLRNGIAWGLAGKR